MTLTDLGLQVYYAFACMETIVSHTLLTTLPLPTLSPGRTVITHREAKRCYILLPTHQFPCPFSDGRIYNLFDRQS